MNEGVGRYVAERVEEGDQHASQGGIAGNAPHVVPLSEFVPFDPVETAMRADSSADLRDTVANDVPSIAVDAPPEDNDAVIESPGTGPGMDLDLVDKKDRTLESCRVREKGTRSDLRLSVGSTKVGVTLVSGRVCHRFSEDARRACPMLDIHRSRLAECDAPRDNVGELDSDMRDRAR